MTRIERLALDDFQIAGNLTIRGVTRPMLLDVSRSQVIVDHTGQRRVAFTASGTLSRKDFGLTWNVVLETAGVMVGDKVTITAEIEAVRLPENLPEKRQVPASASAK